MLPFLLVLGLLPAMVVARLEADCHIPLDPVNDHSCLMACLGKQHTNRNSFVCDVSAQWLHHAGGQPNWYPATPPLGTGVHEYVAFQGTPPCAEVGYCRDCEAPQGKRLCSVRIDPQDCSIQCDETSKLMEHALL
jgi:hypothetical protein